MPAAVGPNNPSRGSSPGEWPSQTTGSGGTHAAVGPDPSSRGGPAPPKEPGVGPASVSLSTEWVAFEPLTDWILSEHCLEAHGFVIVSQLGGDGAYLVTGAGAFSRMLGHVGADGSLLRPDGSPLV